jgi:hypothetical protein
MEEDQKGKNVDNIVLIRCQICGCKHDNQQSCPVCLMRKESLQHAKKANEASGQPYFQDA